jgi:hypothetical protein
MRRLVTEADMSALQDCLVMCGLDSDEVIAAADQEELQQRGAALLSAYMREQSGAIERTRASIIHDLVEAVGQGQTRHGAVLLDALRHLLDGHPETRLLS